MRNCDYCKKTFDLKDKVTALAHESNDPFSTILYGLRAFIDSELAAHEVIHAMEPAAIGRQISLNNKIVEVIGRLLTSFRRDCKTHPGYDHGVFNIIALDGAYRGCKECMDALVRKTRETPVFTTQDAKSVADS